MNRMKIDLHIPESVGHRGARDQIVRQMFGMGQLREHRVLHRGLDLPTDGLVYITGYSGSGKSCLLRKIKELLPHAVNEIPLVNEDESVLNCFSGDVSESIQWLSQFGLGEARVLLTPVKALSVGQRQRLNLALLLGSRPTAIIVDEFLSALDRTTARIIAFQLQKIIRRYRITCFVATAHDDLVDALFADVVVRLDFEGRHEVLERGPLAELPEKKEIHIGEGNLEDYEELKRFHYMDSQIGDDLLNPKDIIAIRTATFRGKTVGVRIFTNVFPHSYERMAIFRVLNERTALSSRVVVHPVFRGLGISRMLDFPFEEFPKVQAVFTHSALAKHFPFDAKNYRATDHTSEVRTSLHDEYESSLLRCGVGDLATLNDATGAREFWQKCSPEERTLLRERLTDVLSDYDTRYFFYLAKELKLNLPKQAESVLRNFFCQQIARIPDDFLGSLLSEGLHFPMQGLVRHRF